MIKAIGRNISSGGESAEDHHPNTTNVRPILIIPGFMSSGLQIKSSSIKKEWDGKRIWLNLKSLGFEVISRKIHDSSKGSTNKSMWLQHMITKDEDVVNIQAIPGLDGVDYLYPGAITSMATYVFGPLLEFLDKNGYIRNQNLFAAPWDWRKAPSELPQDFYDNTLDLIEHTVKTSNEIPVVIIGHSLGAKMGHYLFNYAAKERGLEWISKHIYSFMPVSGTHVGVPKSIKQMVLVDSSCLDPFLSIQELVVFSRSLTSCPWMYPTTLPDGALYHQAYIKPQGILEIRVNTDKLSLPRSSITAKGEATSSATETVPSLRLLVALEDKDSNDRTRVRSVASPWKEEVTEFSNDTFIFIMTDDHDTEKLRNLRLQFYLQQKGGQLKFQKEKFMTKPNRFVAWMIQCMPSIVAKCLEVLYAKIFCCCLVDTLLLLPLDTLLGQAVKKTARSNNNNKAGDVPKTNNDQAVAIEVSEPISWNGVDEECHVGIYPMQDALMYIRRRGCCSSGKEEPETLQSVNVQIRFNPFNNSKTKNSQGLSSPRLCGSLAEQSTKDAPPSSEMIQIISSGKHDGDDVVQYRGISGYELFQREGMDDYLKMIQELYYEDPIGPLTTSAVDAPPGISRVIAIYGINLPTEVGAIYCRKDCCVSDDKIQKKLQKQNLHWLDNDATIVVSGKEEDNHGYVVDGGRILETPQTATKKSGDGTVPYHCLEAVNNWKDTIQDVQIIELEGAEHRDILADERFHQQVLEHCRIPNETV